jgi:mono/diheme cytochrome c family protein
MSSRLEPLLLALLLVAAGGCRPDDMHNQAKLEVYERSTFYPDGRASRPLPEGVVPRGTAVRDSHFDDGKDASGAAATTLPVAMSRDLLYRGKERYQVFCSPCHARTGDGDGMIVRRGYRVPPSLHIERLRTAPPGYYFDVITNGFGAMPDYSAQIPTADRWAIIAYIRALQLSRNARIEDVPPEARKDLEAAR